MRYLFIFLSAILFLSACQKPAESDAQASADAKRFALKGKIVSVDKAGKKASVNHEAIPNYMEAMTMDFPIHDRDVLNTMTAGNEIKADLVVDKGEYWLENIILTGEPVPGQSVVPVNENFAAEGKEIPVFSLTNQDGKKISTNDFRGKALAITFIYSRCPLPNYCIAMSTKFSDAVKQIESNPDLKDKIRLLSISFDPATDTPETLKKYGLGYLGKDAKSDFVVWQLASGADTEIRKIADFFGLRYEVDQNDKTQFNHSLRTIIITPEGKVKKVFSGNDWTVEELMRELQNASETQN